MAGDERRWRREGTRRYLRVDRFGLLFYAHHRGRRTLPIAIFEVVPRLIVAGRVKLRVVPVFRHGLPVYRSGTPCIHHGTSRGCDSDAVLMAVMVIAVITFRRACQALHV